MNDKRTCNIKNIIKTDCIFRDGPRFVLKCLFSISLKDTLTGKVVSIISGTKCIFYFYLILVSCELSSEFSSVVFLHTRTPNGLKGVVT